MTQHTLLRFASLIIFTLAATALTYAVTPQRVFVSAQNGDDANTVNNCSVTLPCRNFNAAIGVVNAGGEVVALDSGGYGPVTVGKAVTLTGPTGVYVAISALTVGSSAIAVSAPGATVVLRGLTLTGLGGDYGINVSAVGTVHIEACTISGFLQNGINVNLTADGGQIFVKDTITRNNFNGVAIRTSTGTVHASIDNCRSERNGSHGFYVFLNSRVTVYRSVATGNAASGFISVSNAAGVTTVVNCEECIASNNAIGFNMLGAGGGTPSLRVTHSTATDNTSYGFSNSGGLFESLGDNLVRGNLSSDTNGSITVMTGN